MAECNLCHGNLGRIGRYDLAGHRICEACAIKKSVLKSKGIHAVEEKEFFENVLKDQAVEEDVRQAVKAFIKEAARDKEAERKEEERLLEEQRQRVQKLKEEVAIKRRTFMTTTGYNFEGYRITEYLGIRSGEIVLGTGLFSEMLASVTDIFGEQSNVMTSKLTTAKQYALNRLIENCVAVGANAVIGVDLDMMTLAQNQMVVCANGTAVKIEKVEG